MKPVFLLLAMVVIGSRLPGAAPQDTKADPQSVKPPMPPATAAANQPVQDPLADKARNGYIVGFTFAQNIKSMANLLDIEALVAGLRDNLAGTDGRFPKEEISRVMKLLNEEAMRRIAQERQQLAERNRQEGEEYLAKNATRPGVVVLPSGLQYRVLQSGPANGVGPKPSDRVKAHYRGRLIDGREFDNSFKRGEPMVFAVNRMIRAWVEALPLMKPGDRWQLFVPAGLAYGERGGGMIGPNCALVFEIQLLEVLPSTPAIAPGPGVPTQPAVKAEPGK